MIFVYFIAAMFVLPLILFVLIELLKLIIYYWKRMRYEKKLKHFAKKDHYTLYEPTGVGFFEDIDETQEQQNK